MRPFSQLLDALVYTRSRNGKLALIAAYLRAATLASACLWARPS